MSKRLNASSPPNSPIILFSKNKSQLRISECVVDSTPYVAIRSTMGVTNDVDKVLYVVKSSGATNSLRQSLDDSSMQIPASAGISYNIIAYQYVLSVSSSLHSTKLCLTCGI